MVVAEGPKIFNIQCVSEGYLCLLKRFFCFQVFVDYISFSFYVKYIWKKCYKNFFRHIVLGVHTIQMVPKYIWMQHTDKNSTHWINLENDHNSSSIIRTFFKSRTFSKPV